MKVAKEAAIVGIPRCGTTYLLRSICGLPPGNSTPKGANYLKMPALKSHNLAPPYTFNNPPYSDYLKEHMKNKGKVIFVFGNIYDAITSTILKRLDPFHAKNCGYSGIVEFEHIDLTKYDHFNYKKMFTSWTEPEEPHNFPVLCVRYETMYDNRKYIEAFLGREVKWNTWKKRTPYTSEEIGIETYKTYKRANQKIENASDIKLFGGK